MRTTLLIFMSVLSAQFRSRLALQMEILALRHQLKVYQRSGNRPRIKPADRIFWVLLCRIWRGWRDVLLFVKPSTVIAWQRRRFRDHWRRLSQRSQPGRPRVAKEIRELIRRMSMANPTWGSPRIVGELCKLGVSVAKSTVERYMARVRKPPSPTWRSFLKSHVKDLVSIDFFVVPTIRFKVLFVLVVLLHHRRRVVHFNVTENPSARWTAQQVVEAFPWDKAPRYLLRDRDGIYGAEFRTRVKNMDIREVLIAPCSPWQSVRGTGNRIHSSGVSGPRDRAERGTPEASPEGLLRLLSPVANPSVARHGLSGITSRSALRRRPNRGVSRGQRAASSLRAGGSLGGEQGCSSWSLRTCPAGTISALTPKPKESSCLCPMTHTTGLTSLHRCPQRTVSAPSTSFREGQGGCQVPRNAPCQVRWA